jgi:hypothetical protein
MATAPTARDYCSGEDEDDSSPSRKRSSYFPGGQFKTLAGQKPQGMPIQQGDLSIPGQAPTLDLHSLPAGTIFMRILGVNYIHLQTQDDGDLYVTSYGVPFFRHLLPENWYEPQWFSEHRHPLEGSGTVYHVETRPIPSAAVKSINLVVKWSRAGQEVPLNTFTLQRNSNAEFNSPFEEFSLVEELRRSQKAAGRARLFLQKPMAIYVPPERMQLWQTGRSREKILAKEARHPGVLIDVLRAYILLYGWVKGVNAVDAFNGCCYEPVECRTKLQLLTERVDEELNSNGFVVSDHKPVHFIVRLCGGEIVRHKNGRVPLALVDYELLARTQKKEMALQAQHRADYLVRQRDRFIARQAEEYPPNLKACSVLGVPYVVGQAESTSGVLWVVGNDPQLFTYFLPERWRGGYVSLSESGRIFYVQTKDRLHLVWRISSVGELPGDQFEPNPANKRCSTIYNNPFEEFAFALEMNCRGVATVYPRAIYMTASPGKVAGRVLDDRAFQQMRDFAGPTGQPVLPMGHDYITIWGYWRGVDDSAAVEDEMLWTPIDVAQATRRGLLGPDDPSALLMQQTNVLQNAGFVDKNLKPDHLLLSYIPGGSVRRDSQNRIAVRHCNMALVKRIRE